MTHNSLSPYEEPIDQVAQLEAELKAAARANGLSPDGKEMDAAHIEVSTEKRPAKERRILASVIIPQPVEQVWQVITDYEHLADFVPNLTVSRLLPNAEGRIRLEQIGAQCFLKVKFCARVVLEMTENFPYELGFAMQEGDFQHFNGVWQLRPTADAQGTHLSYDLLVKPPRAMPAALIERHIRHNVTANLLAIRQRTLELVV